MELLQLRYFHEVAQTQHMTNSAKRLGVAQPALTQAIRRLEGELDAKLFERAGRNDLTCEMAMLIGRGAAAVLTSSKIGRASCRERV